MFTVAFAKAAAERAVKTFAQTLVALLGAGVVNVVHTAWVNDVEIAGGATVLSLLTSIASSTTGNGPSATNSETLA